ncbi:MAG: LysR family transcriptional regulator, partial [Eubacteriales bacterium]|nr:LysR family transcriptional regulator [Eubacteriales bacterium]
MNLNTLKYVIAVSEEQSFTKAAQRLSLTQPTLSLSIKSLETELGTPLFDRTNYPVTLTPAGEVYVEWAREMLLSEDILLRRIRQTFNSNANVIKVGTSPHRANTIMVNIIREYREVYPDSHIVMSSGTTADLYQMLEDGNLDLILEDATNTDKTRFNVRFLQNERVFLAVPKSFNVEGTSDTDGDLPAIRLLDLKDYDFIFMKSGTFLGRTLLELCNKYNFMPNVVVTCSKVETAGVYAAAGFGITLLSELYVYGNKRVADSLDLFNVAGSGISRNLS